MLMTSHFVLHIHFMLIVLLVSVACVASLIDTIAGGGGLITLPVLLMLGLPPAFALGTSKFQACVGELNASIHFIRSKRIDFKKIFIGLIIVAVSATVGALCIQLIHDSVARKIIPWLLLGILVYTYFSPRFQSEHATQKIPTILFFIIFGLTIGFYNGFLGPGTGAFWTFAWMFFMGFDLMHASLYMKPLNMTGTFFSVIFFMIGHHVLYTIASIMMVGQLIGSYIGVHMVLKKGLALIRPIYLSVVTVLMVVMFVKLF
jgi:uncharacterized membrane protein YfcA